MRTEGMTRSRARTALKIAILMWNRRVLAFLIRTRSMLTLAREQ